MPGGRHVRTSSAAAPSLADHTHHSRQRRRLHLQELSIHGVRHRDDTAGRRVPRRAHVPEVPGHRDRNQTDSQRQAPALCRRSVRRWRPPHRVPSTTWSERTIRWSNAPAYNTTVLGTIGAVAVNTWYELDVKSQITGMGRLTLRWKRPRPTGRITGLASPALPGRQGWK